MTTIDIKTALEDRRWFIRGSEIFPGLITWLLIFTPIILSVIRPIWVAYFIIGYDLFWLVKSFRLSTYLILGYRRMHHYGSINWRSRLKDLQNIEKAIILQKQIIIDSSISSSIIINKLNIKNNKREQFFNAQQYLKELEEIQTRPEAILKPRDIYHAVIIATYNESLEILEPTVQSLINSKYVTKKIMLIIAYEERGGEAIKSRADYLIKKYGDNFIYAKAIKHPSNLPGEIIGKGANITYAARQLTHDILIMNINPEHIIVTTLDADNKPGKNYFAYLTYKYATDPNRIHRSYQPMAMFYNNIWDAPAPMRVIAIGNSFWNLMQSVRPHLLRNFSAHAQSLKTLIDTDYWSVSTIVEDGHQYWRTYFTYNGDHKVIPLYVPVFQDAVLAETYTKTIKVQYNQLRRWAWGISDFSYAIRNSIKNKSISWSAKLLELARLLEGHISWATAPLILTFAAWLPLFLNRNFGDQVLAHQLPIITSRILTIAMLGIVVTVFISLISLPPKPKKYRKSRFISMIAQWVMLPVTAIIFGAFPALDAQTRLMIGKSLDFKVTTKTRK